MSGEKTETPSPKRLRKAREDGNVANSKDFSSAFLFLAGAAVLGSSAASDAYVTLESFAKRCWSIGAESGGRLDHLVLETAREGMVLVLILVLPLLGAMVFLALALGFVQTGGLFSVKALGFKIEKLNPVSGLKNTFFSAKSYVELLKSVLKLTVAGYLGYSVIEAGMRDLLMAQRLEIYHSVVLTKSMVGSLVKKIGGLLMAIGIFDLFYQRHTWYKGLMMSKQEQKDEYKQAEGDPQMKGKRKQLAKEIANQKGVKAVKQAKVVVTNPHEIAVALEYDPEGGMDAPQILCKGQRLVAQQIIEEAKKHGVPIMQNIALAHSLNELESGDEVPEELYEAVAEVLNWVYAMAEGLEIGEPAEDEDWGDLEDW
ncbi:MAG: EscU/YscU/HrcU family type III secretion system export apparatus switch protein [Planctomycetota bacterium]|jgi:flagellar biosynthetic protein FlhB